MKQVVQNLKTGSLDLLDVACPKAGRGQLLIQTRASLISSGTERSLLQFGQSNLLSKALRQPERMQQVLDKIKSDGLLPTLEAVRDKLDEPMQVGYCNAGVVAEVGAGVEGFSIGERVVSNGHHAEMISKPLNLCVKTPENVSDEQAAFAVLGAIGLQGIRLLQVGIGETVAVSGLGLIGLLAAQILVSSGVRVLGIDPDPGRLALAESFGVTPVDLAHGADPELAALAATNGFGVDGVLITAAAKHDNIISQAARMSRKRGRLVLVGAVNMELNRADFYEKELSFQVSCSYGPGRYDTLYEDQGMDYPYGFVRWTERRNIEAVLAMLAAGRLNVDRLITSRVPYAEVDRAYRMLTADRSQLGIVLQYPQVAPPLNRVVRPLPVGNMASIGANNAAATQGEKGGKLSVGIIGAGVFTKRFMLPELVKSGARLASIASATGVTGTTAAQKFGIAASTSDYRTILDDRSIQAVFIMTRHNLHAPMVVEALGAGKHVFVEKPLAIDRPGLELVRSAVARHPNLQLMVGFNRRFSPQAKKMRELLAARSEPACLTMLVNPGPIPPSHWLSDPAIGGGRIVGEGCHWVDLMSFLVGAPVASVEASSVSESADVHARDDHLVATLNFADGSLGVLHYFANGHRAFAKEKLTVFCQGRVLELDNFRRLYGYGYPNFKKMNLFRQDKGHRNEIQAFVQRAERGGPPLIDFSEIYNVTQTTFAIHEAANEHRRVDVPSMP